jgi:hypothetical protein
MPVSIEVANSFVLPMNGFFLAVQFFTNVLLQFQKIAKFIIVPLRQFRHIYCILYIVYQYASLSNFDAERIKCEHFILGLGFIDKNK